MLDAILTLFILTGLEIVLGIDNILVVAMVAARMPASERKRAANAGIWMGVALRILLLAGAAWLTAISQPIATISGWQGSPKDFILLAGGLFLLYKSVTEIHKTVEGIDHHTNSNSAPLSWTSALREMMVLNIVFSIDSIITAVGITQHLWVMFTAVIAAALVMMLAAQTITRIINNHPGLKILALAFLVTIGVTLTLEGLHQHVEKTYIYLPMGFALAVELLQMRHAKKTRDQQLPEA